MKIKEIFKSDTTEFRLSRRKKLYWYISVSSVSSSHSRKVIFWY